MNLLSHPYATLAPQARQARNSGENLNYLTLAPQARLSGEILNYLLSRYSDILCMIISGENPGAHRSVYTVSRSVQCLHSNIDTQNKIKY